MGSFGSRRRAAWPGAWVAAVVALGLAPTPGDAGFVVRARVTSPPTALNPGDVAEVTVELVNTPGSGDLVISDFSVQLDIAPSAGVMFTGVTEPAGGPGGYVFAGNSLGFTTQMLDPGGGTAVGPSASAAAFDTALVEVAILEGEIWTLGVFALAVDAAAPGGLVDIVVNRTGSTRVSGPVTINDNGTPNDTDDDFPESFPYALEFADAQVAVNGNVAVAVPAPPAAVLFGLGAVGLAVAGRRSRRPAAR